MVGSAIGGETTEETEVSMTIKRNTPIGISFSIRIAVWNLKGFSVNRRIGSIHLGPIIINFGVCRPPTWCINDEEPA